MGTDGMAKRQWTLFARDTRATTVVEFALLAPIFFAVIAAILQTSLTFFAGQVLESGMNDASRAIRVGEASRETWTAANFKAEVCGRLYGLFGDCSDLHIDVRQINTFADATITVPLDLNCAQNCNWTEPDRWTPGTASSVMLVQVYYRYPSYLNFGPTGASHLPDGRRLLSSATIFRNEPF
jgi:Flp pilus assembly protein TadG